MNPSLVDVGFWLCAVVSVVAGTLVFYVDSMARATYALAVSFVAVGVTLLLMGQAYMGVIVILMMVMEMAVMAVYMVMFMGMNPALMPMSMVHSHRSSCGNPARQQCCGQQQHNDARKGQRVGR